MFGRRKMYKKGIEDAMQAYQSFGHKQEDALNKLRDEVKQGNLTLESMMDSLGNDIINVFEYLSDQEKKAMYKLHSQYNLKELESTEKQLLIAILYQLSSEEVYVSENQKVYLSSLQKYLDILNPQISADLKVVEAIDSIEIQKAFMQCVLEFFYLQDCDEISPSQEDFLGYFSVSKRQAEEIELNVSKIYNAIGGVGLAYKYVPIVSKNFENNNSISENLRPEYKEAIEALSNYELAKAFDLLGTLSEQGCGRANYLLGEIFYKKGYNGVKTDSFKAKQLFKDGMKQGDILCKINYAYTLEAEEKERLLQDSILELEYLVQNNDIICEYEYADLILSGRVKNKSIKEGMQLMKNSADKGWWIAAKRCGEIYFYGSYDVKMDYFESWSYFMKVAELGDIESMKWVARFYEGDRGLERDLDTEAAWYIKAAKAGDLDAYVCAGVVLYVNGKQKEGLWWLREAAKKGSSEAVQQIKNAFGAAYDSSCLSHDCEIL